jgi:nucleolar MIF4G domain-containing protein 1
MSRKKCNARGGITLPSTLQKELGLETPRFGNTKHLRGGGRASEKKPPRRDQRQERRNVSVHGKRNHINPAASQKVIEHSNDLVHEEATDEIFSDSDEPVRIPTKRSIKRATVRSSSSPSLSEDSDTLSRESSPGIVLDPNSRSFRDRAAQDDDEISALERKLGLKPSTAATEFEDDGLNDLLGGLEGKDRGTKRKTDAKDWLARKRWKADVDESSNSEDDSAENELEGSDMTPSDEEDVTDDQHTVSSEDDDAFEGFNSDQDDTQASPPAKRVRENPYVAPVAPNTSGKYIPPSLRKAPTSAGASLEKLKRQLQGHLNKLSEANLVSILAEVESVYQTNPRQDVSTVLIDLLITLFCNKSALQNTFVILHAAFATAVYKVIGVDFGAELLSRLLDKFDTHHSNVDSTGKEALNLLSLLSNLFTFNIVRSPIVFDHIRLLLADLCETNTELLLRLIRDCGPQLRQDDPTSLKEIVQTMQKQVAKMTSAGEQMSVRTKFMIETITDLKNNKMKGASTANAGLASEHITLMRKVLGSLNNRQLKASEPLKISREDIKNSDRKGKWWLVGASWKGNDPTGDIRPTVSDLSDPMEDVNLDKTDASEIDLQTLARNYGMNTVPRRLIFTTLLSSIDYRDAHTRLLKLHLKRSQQESEIPKVLLRCAGAETPYNAYYALVAHKLCLSDKRTRKGFTFALWEFFRRLGEKPSTDDDDGDDEDEGEDGRVEMCEIANTAKFYAHLILTGSETLGILKVLDLAIAKVKTLMFVELLLITILVEAKDKQNKLEGVFKKVSETPQMLRRLQFFIKKNVRNSDLVSKNDRGAMKTGIRMALETLRDVEMRKDDEDR